MATKFYDAPGGCQPKRLGRETKFTHYLDSGPVLHSASAKPYNYRNVQYLFTDGNGYDYFKAWDTEGYYGLYIGNRGDEYYEPC